MSTTIFHDIAAGQAPGPVIFTVEQFHRRLDEGIVADGDAVELIEGVVMPKDRGAQGDPTMAHSKRHAVAVARIQRRLERRIGDMNCHARTRLPLALSGTSEPEPDVAVVAGMDEAYLDSHRRAADALLVIEVADSSLPMPALASPFTGSSIWLTTRSTFFSRPGPRNAPMHMLPATGLVKPCRCRLKAMELRSRLGWTS